MKSLCRPALLYLVISVITFIFMITTLSLGSLAVKALFIFVWTWFLNFLCRKGHIGISWFLVLLPFVFMVIIFFFAKDVAKMGMGVEGFEFVTKDQFLKNKDKVHIEEARIQCNNYLKQVDLPQKTYCNNVTTKFYKDNESNTGILVAPLEVRLCHTDPTNTMYNPSNSPNAIACKNFINNPSAGTLPVNSGVSYTKMSYHLYDQQKAAGLIHQRKIVGEGMFCSDSYLTVCDSNTVCTGGICQKKLGKVGTVGPCYNIQTGKNDNDLCENKNDACVGGICTQARNVSTGNTCAVVHDYTPTCTDTNDDCYLGICTRVRNKLVGTSCTYKADCDSSLDCKNGTCQNTNQTSGPINTGLTTCPISYQTANYIMLGCACSSNNKNDNNGCKQYNKCIDGTCQPKGGWI